MLQAAYIGGLVLIAFMGTSAFFATRKKPNHYGRYLAPNEKKTINARLGWLIFEAPQWSAFAITFWLTALPENRNSATFVLFGLWQCHYTYRALIMPFLMRNTGKRLPISTIWFGLPFNTANGFVNAYAVGHVAHLAEAGWLNDPRFAIGLAIAAIGWIINVQADNILFRLRAPGETGYKIPHGGMFRYVSGANYLGEIILWAGWAIMSWTLAGLVFLLFTIANLAPRAISHHKWYRAQFPDYPPQRRALIPGLL